jgi:iron complex transport system substrate-binding protein
VCPEVAERKCIIVADSWTAQTEQIRAAQPDLVIASVPYQEKAVLEILKSGARFLGLAPRTLMDIYGDIALLANIVGQIDRGQALIATMREEIETVRVTTSGADKPTVFCEEWGKPLIASQPWVAELVEAAGGQFVGTPAAHTTAEAIVAANPDVFIAAWCGAGDRVPLQKIVRDRGWTELKAVQTKRVYCIRDEFLNTPGPTLMQGLRALAYALHPELFAKPSGIRGLGD